MARVKALQRRSEQSDAKRETEKKVLRFKKIEINSHKMTAS
jgi:DNA-binding response OmpR family regulator